MNPVKDGKNPKVRQFRKIELAKPKEPAAGGCTPGAAADPDAPPC
jgi:hypothetical protein